MKCIVPTIFIFTLVLTSFVSGLPHDTVASGRLAKKLGISIANPSQDEIDKFEQHIVQYIIHRMSSSDGAAKLAHHQSKGINCMILIKVSDEGDAELQSKIKCKEFAVEELSIKGSKIKVEGRECIPIKDYFLHTTNNESVAFEAFFIPGIDYYINTIFEDESFVAALRKLSRKKRKIFVGKMLVGAVDRIEGNDVDMGLHALLSILVT